MTEKQKFELQNLRGLYAGAIYFLSLDFVNDTALSDDSFISDSFTEYADNAVSIYSSDQFNYFTEHSEECEQALLNYYDPNSIYRIIEKDGLHSLCCRAGAVGAYEKNLEQLTEDQEKITRILIIDFLLNTNIYLSFEDIEEIASYECDTWSEYCDIINEKTKGE